MKVRIGKTVYEGSDAQDKLRESATAALARANPQRAATVGTAAGGTSSAGVAVLEIPPGAEAICASCPDQRGCRNVTVCCGGTVTVNILMPCPLGKW